jgi:hypothetical protein
MFEQAQQCGDRATMMQVTKIRALAITGSDEAQVCKNSGSSEITPDHVDSGADLDSARTVAGVLRTQLAGTQNQ